MAEFPVTINDSVEFTDSTEAVTHPALVWQRCNPPVRPDRRFAASLGYTTEDDSIIMFGGSVWGATSGPLFDDTWKYKNGIWTELNPSTVPAARSNAMFATDSLNSRLLMFGGWWGNVSTYIYNDIWEYVGGDWNCLRAHGESGNPGTPNGGLAVDPANNCAVYLSWAWACKFDFAAGTWTTHAHGLPVMEYAGAAYNPNDGLIYFFDSGCRLYTFDSTTNMVADVTPSAANNVSGYGFGRPFFWWPRRGSFVTVREYGGSWFEMWELDLATPKWSQIHFSGTEQLGPPPRERFYYGASCGYMVLNPVDNELVTFGGEYNHSTNNMHASDGYKSQQETRVLKSGVPPSIPTAINTDSRWMPYHSEGIFTTTYEYGKSFVSNRAQLFYHFLVDILGFTLVQESAAGAKSFASTALLDSGSDGVLPGGNFNFSSASASFSSSTVGKTFELIDSNDHRNTTIAEVEYYIDANTISFAPQGGLHLESARTLGVRRWPVPGSSIDWKLFDFSLGPDTTGDWFVVRSPHASGYEVKVEIYLANVGTPLPRSHVKVSIGCESGSWSTGLQDWNVDAPVLSRVVRHDIKTGPQWSGSSNPSQYSGSPVRFWGLADGSSFMTPGEGYNYGADAMMFGIADTAEGLESSRERVYLLGPPDDYTTFTIASYGGQSWSDRLWEPIGVTIAGNRHSGSKFAGRALGAYDNWSNYEPSRYLGRNSRSNELDTATIFLYTSTYDQQNCLRGRLRGIKYGGWGVVGDTSYDDARVGYGVPTKWRAIGYSNDSLLIPWSG